MVEDEKSQQRANIEESKGILKDNDIKNYTYYTYEKLKQLQLHNLLEYDIDPELYNKLVKVTDDIILNNKKVRKRLKGTRVFYFYCEKCGQLNTTSAKGRRICVYCRHTDGKRIGKRKKNEEYMRVCKRCGEVFRTENRKGKYCKKCKLNNKGKTPVASSNTIRSIMTKSFPPKT